LKLDGGNQLALRCGLIVRSGPKLGIGCTGLVLVKFIHFMSPSSVSARPQANACNHSALRGA
jgi:hypothetical protein